VDAVTLFLALLLIEDGVLVDRDLDVGVGLGAGAVAESHLAVAHGLGVRPTAHEATGVEYPVVVHIRPDDIPGTR